MERMILHVDLNNFYASVECLYNPAIRGQPVIVCGDAEARHGIVLAKNNLAKSLGIKTGEAIWQARQKAENLIAVPADFRKYLKFSKLARTLYADYTDQIEPFGIDEAWLDVSGSGQFGDGRQIADRIRQRMKAELGLTVSVGVSFNKIFAKLGSDMRKPDAVTQITREHYKEIVWPLPVKELLCVGRSTKKKLNNRAIYTIGDLAGRPVEDLRRILGVWGETLHAFANGMDFSEVRKAGAENIMKSVGNSMTAPRDLLGVSDARIVAFILSESVAARLREQGLKCTGVAIHVKNKEFISFERQAKLSEPSFTSNTIADEAMRLLGDHYDWKQPIRSLGIRGIGLVTARGHQQLGLFFDDKARYEKLEFAIDQIRRRFGHASINRAVLLSDARLTGLNPKDEHVIHPVAYFH